MHIARQLVSPAIHGVNVLPPVTPQIVRVLSSQASSGPSSGQNGSRFFKGVAAALATTIGISGLGLAGYTLHKLKESPIQMSSVNYPPLLLTQKLDGIQTVQDMSPKAKAAALYSKGVLYVHANHYGKAETCFKAVLDIDPSADKAAYKLYSLYKASGRLTQASELRDTYPQIQEQLNTKVGVIGLGIGGAATARALGENCVGYEMGFPGGTARYSTELLHGGARYLNQAFLAALKGIFTADLGQLTQAKSKYDLVLDSITERNLMLTQNPNLVKQRRFIVLTDSAFNLAYIGAGVMLYNALGLLAMPSIEGAQRFPFGRILSATETQNSAPNLAPGQAGYGSVELYEGAIRGESYTQEVARSAQDRGAELSCRTKVLSCEDTDTGVRLTIQHLTTGEVMTEDLKRVVTAKGSYQAEDAPEELGPITRKLKGSHIYTDGPVTGNPDTGIIVTLPNSGIKFVNTNRTYLGRDYTKISTTEDPGDQRNLHHASPSEAEVSELSAVVTDRFEGDITIVRADSGIRPIVVRSSNPGDPSSQSRAFHVFKSESGKQLYLVGPKISDSGSAALAVLAQLGYTNTQLSDIQQDLRSQSISDAQVIDLERYLDQNGAALSETYQQEPELIDRIFRSHGTKEALEMLELCKQHPELNAPVAPGFGLKKFEVIGPLLFGFMSADSIIEGYKLNTFPEDKPLCEAIHKLVSAYDPWTGGYY